MGHEGDFLTAGLPVPSLDVSKTIRCDATAGGHAGTVLKVGFDDLGGLFAA